MLVEEEGMQRGMLHHRSETLVGIANVLVSFASLHINNMHDC